MSMFEHSDLIIRRNKKLRHVHTEPRPRGREGFTLSLRRAQSDLSARTVWLVYSGMISPRTSSK